MSKNILGPVACSSVMPSKHVRGHEIPSFPLDAINGQTKPGELHSESYDAISNYIENYYNAKRRHWAAGNQSPINFELANSGRLAA